METLEERYYFKHHKYPSLDNFREKLRDYYLQNLGEVIVQEKIHGANAQFSGRFKNGECNIMLGSRNRWIEPKETFHNLHDVYNTYSDNIIGLFNEIKTKIKDTIIIRLFGEIFGGKYGTEKYNYTYCVQKEPNYCPHNDIAFFDIMVNGEKLNVIESHKLFEKFNLKIAPVIFRGQIKDFLSNFEIDKFKSVVSTRLYNLPYIKSPKSTEGVTIRMINPPSEKQEIIIKYKQTWALESGRPKNYRNVNYDNDFENKCNDIVNYNRISSYRSKITVEEFLDIKQIAFHVRNIVEDIIIDIKKESNQTITKNINKKLYRIVFAEFKRFVRDIDEENITNNLTIVQRIEQISCGFRSTKLEIDSIRERISHIRDRINY